jgi:hypothetical protein
MRQRSNRDRQRGQALVFVALAMVATTAIVGLAVDLGWSFYVRKQARAAVDAAAMAAAKRAYEGGVFACMEPPCTPGSPCMVCRPAKTPCADAGGNLEIGCQYAAANNFPQPDSTDQVSIQSDTGTFTTATGTVNTHYWVTAYAVRNVPRLFSRIITSDDQVVTAKATAALVDVVVDGSLILLNRENDPVLFSNQKLYGPNLLVQANDNKGMYAVQLEGGIRMASECNGTNSTGPTHCSSGNKMVYAGMNTGGGTVKAKDIAVRGAGDVDKTGSARWIPKEISHPGSGYNDPYAGKTAPPPPPSDLPDRPILDGVLNATNCNPCTPGKYYAVRNKVDGTCCEATGDPLIVDTNVTFAGGDFGEFVFYGGVKKGAGQATVNFGPGRYVFAGAKASNGPGVLLDSSTNFSMRDATGGYGEPADAGELFIMTNGTYGGRISPPTTHWTAGLESQLKYGTVDFQSGNNNTVINLHGLNPSKAPDGLKNYGPLFLWWDRDNSFVKHDATGIVDPTCATTLVDCYRTLENENSPELTIQASPDVHLYGVIYQPRGAWTSLTGGGGYSGPLQLITGALNVQGNANITMTAPDTPLTVTMVALIE